MTNVGFLDRLAVLLHHAGPAGGADRRVPGRPEQEGRRLSIDRAGRPASRPPRPRFHFLNRDSALLQSPTTASTAIERFSRQTLNFTFWPGGIALIRLMNWFSLRTASPFNS